MNCDTSGKFIMKYMDGDLTPDETEMLNNHVSDCEICRKDFEVYRQLTSAFEASDFRNALIPAPEDFELKVMEAVKALPVKNGENKSESLLFSLWSLFSLVSCLAFVLIINEKEIFSYLASVPGLERYLKTAVPVSDYVINFTNKLTEAVTLFSSEIYAFMADIRYVLLILCGIAAMVQFFIVRRNKIEIK